MDADLGIIISHEFRKQLHACHSVNPDIVDGVVLGKGGVVTMMLKATTPLIFAHQPPFTEVESYLW